MRYPRRNTMSEAQVRKETILSETKLRLYAPLCPGADKAPVLLVEIFENNPRMRVRTNVPNDANKGYIDAAMNSKVFYKLMLGIRKLADGTLLDDAGKKMQGFRIENYGHPFLNNQRSKEKRVVSITSVFRNEQGIITINISAGQKRPMINFVFLEDDYHYFKDLDGNAMSEKVSSELAAESWANMFENFITVALKDYVTPAWVLKRQEQQAQNGGGNQWGGGNNGGGGGYNAPKQNYQSQSNGGGYQPATNASNIDSFDMDIPI
jgi:hypothetical protein